MSNVFLKNEPVKTIDEFVVWTSGAGEASYFLEKEFLNDWGMVSHFEVVKIFKDKDMAIAYAKKHFNRYPNNNYRVVERVFDDYEEIK